MSYLIFLLPFLMLLQPVQPAPLPTDWDKDFTISLAYGNTMSSTTTNIQFTYATCTYKSVGRDGKSVSHTFKLTDASRKNILKKLRELKVDQIQSQGGTYAVNDGWSQSICLGLRCIEGGTSAEMSAEHKNLFLDAYRFLEQYAINKRF